MLLNRAALELAKLASKEESRYTLQGISIEKDCAIATDGHILVHLANPSAGMADSDFPVIEGQTARAMNGTNVLVHRDAAIAALKAIPRKSNIPVLRSAMMAEGGKLVVTDLASTQTFPHEVEGTFPNWRQIMPAEDKVPAVTIGFDPRLMKQLCDYFIATGGPRAQTVKLSIYDPTSTMKLEGKTEAEQDVTALLMPRRLPPTCPE